MFDGKVFLALVGLFLFFRLFCVYLFPIPAYIFYSIRSHSNKQGCKQLPSLFLLFVFYIAYCCHIIHEEKANNQTKFPFIWNLCRNLLVFCWNWTVTPMDTISWSVYFVNDERWNIIDLMLMSVYLCFSVRNSLSTPPSCRHRPPTRPAVHIARKTGPGAESIGSAPHHDAWHARRLTKCVHDPHPHDPHRHPPKKCNCCVSPSASTRPRCAEFG